jgi:hypothetical protein
LRNLGHRTAPERRTSRQHRTTEQDSAPVGELICWIEW